jgi:hypothetical protein
MRKFYLLIAGALCACIFFSCSQQLSHKDDLKESENKNQEYDGPEQASELEFQKTQDPSLGFVPYNRMGDAIAATELSKQSAGLSRTTSTLLWEARGPIYDSVGPSNGNTRGGNLYTAGRMAAVLIDTINDPSGNTVIVGGISGGVWKCTNFLSAVANWYIVNDYFGNMAISSICQDPAHPATMYFSTGEATSNADAHFGAGVWKSTDAGETWSQLPSSVSFIRNFKMLCDPAGNVYLASRTTATPVSNLSGLLRSNDGGVTWTNITPTAQGTATISATCTDIELSSTGKLFASFGYSTGGAAALKPYVTTTPATVTQAVGWTLGTGSRSANGGRMELACIADTVYGITSNASNNADSCYKSVDGGVTWTKQNTTIIPGGLGNGQAWYDLTLSVNPANTHELMGGGLDAYRSINDGVTWTRQTFWVTTIPYVHADHHFQQWWKKGNESRIVIGCDGGIFYSNDGGWSWLDKNRNLSLKQFYCAAIHPAAGSPYLLAGAQDNGTHQLKNPGLSYSIEVTGGDGMYCYINQQDPSIQFASYVYSNYRRSTNGGQTWSSFPTNNNGLFTNPFDYDDGQNILYGSYTANNLYRLTNANTSTAFTVVPVAALSGSAIGALKVSPYTPNRLFLGSTSGGRVLRLDNANATPTITQISSGFPAGYINCVNTGSSDNFLVATYTNYGINNVWYSNDGGTTWAAIDGNLPDMPVWWALFDPTDNTKLILGTETGVWTTEQVNGASTVWNANPGFPTTRCAMLRMRSSDNTIVAASYGRGLFTAVLSTNPSISFAYGSTVVTEQSAGTTGCRSYKDYVLNVGEINPLTGDATVTYNIQSGNTAKQGVDFDFTTNGSFTSPSNQHVFVSGAIGAAAQKQITVRIYDDAEVESPESFTIGFTISGTTNALPGYAPTHTFLINDNDRFPAPAVSGNFSIGTYDSTLSTLNTPFNGSKLKHRVQVMYTANELNTAGITLNAKIASMNIRVKTKNSIRGFNNFRISMANTGSKNLNSGFIVSLPMTTVFASDSFVTVAGDNTFNFPVPFQWDGNSNLVIQFCFDNISGTPDGLIDAVEGMKLPLGSAVRASAYSNHTVSIAPGCALALSATEDSRMNATFAATFGDPVATVLNSSSRSENLGSANDLFYYTPNGEIMARIINMSPHNYGCSQVIINRAGSGVSQFWNSNTDNYLMNKTFRVIPTTNNTTGKYEITFYFTKQEKDGWETATGRSWNEIQIVKLPSSISNVSPATAQPDGPGTIEVRDAVKKTFGTGYTLSAVFETGFSAFGFGVPGRMNTILTLSGHVDANKRDIDLDWATSAEINSSIFEVEKSYDGTNFHKIGVLQAAGNKLTPSSYSFVDGENVQKNYYRIKMLHTDGYVLYSNTIFIDKSDAPQRLFIYPNPFVNNLTVRLARPSTGPVTFSIYDAAGKLVKRYSEVAGSPSYTVNTKGIISRAIYMLRVNADGQELSARIMKE